MCAVAAQQLDGDRVGIEEARLLDVAGDEAILMPNQREPFLPAATSLGVTPRVKSVLQLQ